MGFNSGLKMLNKKRKSVKCIYVAIGQKASTLFSKSELKLANIFFTKTNSTFFLSILAVHEGINIAMNSFEREFSDFFAGVPLHEI
jgi:F0F1-type ATP synthase alpha subunit